jgi:hypothetical protein
MLKQKRGKTQFTNIRNKIDANYKSHEHEKDNTWVL